METFFDYMLREPEPELQSLRFLDEWSCGFWELDSQNIKLQFAQQGYEEKGYGHINQIIANVRELLGKYFEEIYQSNEKIEEKVFLNIMEKGFKANLILFYVAAHLHDIGIGFPGIFEALSDYIKEKGQNPLHIGEVIHDYHQYASFIILVEISCMESFDNETIKKRPYLKNLSEIGKTSKTAAKPIEHLKTLDNNLKDIYNKYFDGFFKEFTDFKVILAILCLLHKEIDHDYVHNILRKFKKDDANLMAVFNKWWSYFERTKLWTEKIYRRFSRDNSNKLPDCSDAELLKDQSDQRIDLSLVEALLQYGDKTEITIARLTREPIGYKKIPLEDFLKDTKHDDKKGYICTDMSQRVISDFARFRACRFIPVPLIKVEKSYETTGPGLNIVIHYLRFTGDDDIFKLIRYHNEKDFFDLSFLRVIRFHIPTIIKFCSSRINNPILTLTFKKDEHSIRDEENLKGYIESVKEILQKEDVNNQLCIDKLETQASLNNRHIFPYTQQNRQAIEKFSQTILNPELRNKEKRFKKVFYETCDLEVPASFEVMAVLNLFMGEE
jgi:hypothetical protein